MTYLDHAASTTLRPEARLAVDRVWAEGPANPTGAHSRAQAARALLEEARERLAAVAGVRPRDVVFTSGGTESDNWAIWAGARRGRVLYSAVEHPAIAEPARVAGGEEIPVDSDGVVDLDVLEALLKRNSAPVGIVSVMAANNETGVMQPLDRIAAVVAEQAPEAILHTDAVQAFGKETVPMGTAGDPGPHVASITAHKLGGPIGTGAMVFAAGTELEPFLLGGGQEQGRRAGTPDPAGALAFAVAAEAAAADDWDRIRVLRDRLESALCERFPDLVVHGAGAPRLPTHCYVGLPGLAADTAVIACDRAGLAISSGSSCASGAHQPSGVLAAMGASGEGALRLSLGWSTTDADADEALETITSVVGRLRPTVGVAGADE